MQQEQVIFNAMLKESDGVLCKYEVSFDMPLE